VFLTQLFKRKIPLQLETILQKVNQSPEKALKRNEKLQNHLNSKTSRQDVFLMKIKRKMFKSSSNTRFKS